jgi:hypothetical protein
MKNEPHRLEQFVQFYSILDRLEREIGGARRLADCSAKMKWPARGVYFFQEVGERRSNSGDGPRIVRVGTHALKTGSGTKLWTRLSQHKGQSSTGGGNHRGSIFRLIVGAALIQRDGRNVLTWGKGDAAAKPIRAAELELERQVSQVITDMTFVWLPIEDPAGPDSSRGYIERNAIALLSNYLKVPPLDPPSPNWLGRHATRALIRESGLWNQNHVKEVCDPAFLEKLDHLVRRAA